MKINLPLTLILLILFLPSCSHKPVRHLASDICLMTQGTSKKEVLTYMGSPDEQRTDQQGELWIYYQVNKSLLRKTPYIGGNFGDENVDVVTIRFAGDLITTCVYRSLTDEEFRKSGIGDSYDPID